MNHCRCWLREIVVGMLELIVTERVVLFLSTLRSSFIYASPEEFGSQAQNREFVVSAMAEDY